MLSVILSAALVGIGISAGLIVSFIGASGVVLVVPALMLLFHTDIYTALGTSLLVDCIGSTVVSYQYWRHDRVELKAGTVLIVSAVVGTQIGVLLAKLIGAQHMGRMFAFFVLAMGVGMLVRSYRAQPSRREEVIAGVVSKVDLLKSSILGLLIGLFSGIFGAGGGLLVLIVLTTILRYPIHKAIGTSTFIMAIIALSASFGYFSRGDVNLVYSIYIGTGSLLGGFFGSRLANRLDEQGIKKVMGMVFILLGIISFVST